MRVLWITNIMFPEAMQLLSGSGELKASGGWLLGAARSLLSRDEIELCVATVSKGVKKLTCLKGKDILYYLLPYGKGNQHINLDYCVDWKKVHDEFHPDVVHIHGTEYSHGYAYIKSCGSDNVIVSIQGMTSAYYYYYYGVSIRDVFGSLTLRDMIKGTMIRGKRNFQKRGQYEIETIRSVHHIIGRTCWDKARTWAINPEVEYHFCNETLRPEFYDGSRWNYSSCNKYTIFLSQASYPIKGLHQVIRAMPYILTRYPDACLRVAGNNITKCSGLKGYLRYTGYGRFINQLIKKYGLKEKVYFTGELDGNEMKNEYLKANVFVCPSSIENSPNSLGEAQILGTPCVASYVGGVPDMMKGNEANLYRFEEVEMLAEKICCIFDNKDSQVDMRKAAFERHNADVNSNALLDIYDKIYASKIN